MLMIGNKWLNRVKFVSQLPEPVYHAEPNPTESANNYSNDIRIL